MLWAAVALPKNKAKSTFRLIRRRVVVQALTTPLGLTLHVLLKHLRPLPARHGVGQQISLTPFLPWTLIPDATGRIEVAEKPIQSTSFAGGTVRRQVPHKLRLCIRS